MQIVLLKIADIEIGTRLRRVNEDWVNALLTSMRERAGGEALYFGQEDPIEVGPLGDRHGLIDGAHRMAALERGGSDAVWAIVKDLAPEQRRLWEIDTQLFRVELTAFNRAAFLHARKEIYEELHPEARAKIIGGKARQDSATDIVSFAGDTAEKVGLGADTVTRLTSMYGRLSAASRETIPGTPVENSRKDLDLLSRQGEQRQGRILRLIATGKAESVAEAIAAIEGRADRPSPAEHSAQKLLDGWSRAPAAARRTFLAALADDDLVEAAAARGYLMVPTEKKDA